MKRGKEMSRAQETIERIEQEFATYRKNTIEWSSAEDIFDNAHYIHICSVGIDYIIQSIEEGRSNLAIYDRIEDVYGWFYNFHMGSLDGAITEETIQEFEEYMLEELMREERSKQEERTETDKNKPTFRYSDLSEEAQQKAYNDALAYIEAEYADADDQNIIQNKEVHAKDEAENCAVYFEDGSLAELI